MRPYKRIKTDMATEKRTAIYPGTFDPVTSGHLDVLHRALTLFDRVIVAVAKNAGKKPVFTAEERARLFAENVKDLKNVEVEAFDGLTIDFARAHRATAIIRGLRAVSDFEFEFQMAQMNRHLDNHVETVFLMTSHKHFFTSSTLIKQVAEFNAEGIRNLVPDNVIEALRSKL